jgi:citrate lyase beta subunit
MARLRRSLLFVPGAERRKLERARQAGADVLIFDLEDSVAPERKARARALVAETLAGGGFGDTELAVRVNALGSPEFQADCEAVVAAGAQSLVLPKIESPQQLAEVGARLDALESRLGIAPGEGVALLALVESAAGVARAPSLSEGSPRLEALCFGHADFLLDMGVPAGDASRGVAFHARCAVAIAARASGRAAVDSICLSVRDDAAFAEDARLGASLGFEGKLCIHPAQVALAHEIHTPTPDQVEQALRVVAAWEEAQARGQGVFVLDSRMIDAPLVSVQQRVLERARRAGVWTGSASP